MAAIISDLHLSPMTTARHCLQLLGHMAASTYVVRLARLRLRPLQAWLASVYVPHRHSLTRMVLVPPQVLSSLDWWRDPREVMMGVPFREFIPSVTLITDASDRGWGAHISHDQGTQGLWSLEERALHINVRELRAVRLACKAFLHFLRGSVVRVLTDNTAAMFYMNRQGGARSSALCQEAIHLWDFAVRHGFHLSASHLPGVRNSKADRLSRFFSPRHEWSLHQDIVACLFQRWGTPRLDLFATAENRKCPRFCSLRGREPGSLSDAFLIPWTGDLMYAFPPVPLLPQVLLKIKRDRADIILIAPAWPRQHWYSMLLDLSITEPIPLPRRCDLISQDHGRLLHPDLDSLHLTAWRLCG
ncbi:uncharacterized protein [Emydura macquarii macquarii]|uniref:uncharacterized protein n=1 Tax=Emydura macquarii macquarii TaxID=1129001 RepID=UPI00352B80CB